jgi:hypothetical protein
MSSRRLYRNLSQGDDVMYGGVTWDLTLLMMFNIYLKRKTIKKHVTLIFIYEYMYGSWS